MSDQWPHREDVDGEWDRCNAYPTYNDRQPYGGGWMCPGEDVVGPGGCADCMTGQMVAEIERLREIAAAKAAQKETT